jgi:glycosyltransferase involved in cell wall biosynthesis
VSRPLLPRVLRRARFEAGRPLRLARNGRRWAEIRRTPPAAEGVRVFYGHDRLPGPDDVVYGGQVKFQLLAEAFPNAPRDFNVVYLGSSSIPLDAARLVRLARRRGALFVWNQNGVAYRGWAGEGFDRINRPRLPLFHDADHVVFQSAFCKLGTDRFYGERSGSWEILHNPVDTARFAPEASRRPRPLTLLLGGNQYQRYRLETALEAVAVLRRDRPDARLLVGGELSFAVDAAAQTAALVERLGLREAVELLGPYTQREAPGLIRRADVLLHTKYNDPCPTIVLEAMACGLPVVYSASGGVPELVGDDAGIGIPAPLDWERDHPPDAGALASAVLEVALGLEQRGAAARQRAVDRFDARRWIARHRELFEELRAR